jgi:hypothetical protein
MPRYRVNVGIDYPPNKRAEVGDIVEDIPSASLKWLVDQGIIELADTKKAAPVVVDEVSE